MRAVKEEQQLDEEIAAHREEMARVVAKPRHVGPLPWWQRASQGDWYDEWGVPWYKDKHIGPMPLGPGEDGGEGRWVRLGGVLTEKQALE